MKLWRCRRLHKEGSNINNSKIREEQNVFNIHNKVLKSRTQWKYGGQADSEGSPENTQPKKEMKLRKPTVGMEGPQQTLQEVGTDHAWPNPGR
jgi:hypothetical protein